MHKIVSLLFIFAFISGLKAQEYDKQWMQSYIEELAENSESEEAAANIQETLENYLDNPLDLNTATADELRIFPFLSEYQINSILKYRRYQGRFLSIYELQYVYGFNQTTAKKLAPFITVVVQDKKYKPSLKRQILGGRNTLFLRTEFNTQNAAGYLPIEDSLLKAKPNSRYLGSKYKIYARYSYQYKQSIKYGFTLEKDPGEAFFGKSQTYGFDFISAHLQIQHKKYLNNLVIGDYSAFFGQGLVLYSGFGTGKSAYPLLVRKKVSGFRKYSSVNENQFLRGIGASLKYRKWTFSPFFSYNFADANLQTLDTINDREIYEISSLQTSGLHATVSQIADKNTIGILLSGANLAYRFSNLNLSATYVYTHFSEALNKQQKVYQINEFNGQQVQNFSIDYYYIFKQHFHFFGEEAYSSNGGVALINSVKAKLAPQVELVILHRYYSPDYYALYAGGFGEASHTNNENGLYFGTEIYPYKFWKISAYADSYTFPWMRFGAYAPSKGYDYFIQLDKHVAHDFDIYARYKTETKQKNQKGETLSRLVNTTKKSLRINASYRINNYLILKSRAEFSFYKIKGVAPEKGYLLYQDANIKALQIPLSLSFRFAIFNTRFDTRIYAYENDILYAFSIPAYFDKGSRIYANLKYSIAKNIDIWLRWSEFYYPYKKVISSGLNAIQGNTKTQIKIQLRVKF